MAWSCACGQENPPNSKFCDRCGAPRPEGAEAAAPSGAPPAQAPDVPKAPPPAAPPAAPPPPPSRTAAAAPPPRKGFPTALVLALVGAGLIFFCLVGGIVAAIAIPNFLAAKERGKQKRAMSEIQAIASACAAYETDHGAYPATGHDTDSYYSLVDAEALRSLLEPAYIPKLPAVDPWGAPYSYGVSADGREYILLCGGSDKKVVLNAIPTDEAGTHCFEDDMVFENGRFLRYPEGPQKKCS